jgi:phage gp36-like protein
MSYCSPTDLAKVKTTAELLQVADLALTGDIANAGVQAVLQAACDQASNLIDGLISPQYPLPLADVPPTLVSICVRLALYYLYLGRCSLPDDLKTSYKNDTDFLRRAGEGHASLGEPAMDGGGDRFHGAKAASQHPKFNERNMRGF